MQSRFIAVLLSIIICLSMFTGCSKEQILGWFGDSESTPVAPRPGVQTRQSSQQPFFELNINPAVRTSSCYAKFDTFESGTRPSILRIKSYASPDDETYPSFLLYAQVPERSLGSLVDKELNGSFYATQREDAIVYHHVDGEDGAKLKFKITEVTDNGLVGEITGGNITETHNVAPQGAGGKFYAQLQD